MPTTPPCASPSRRRATPQSDQGPVATREANLAIEGMTCAACVARVEKALNRVDGATASVSLATERARVLVPEGIDDTVLIQAVRAAGYGARAAADAPLDTSGAVADAAAHLRIRLIVAVVLSAPVLLVSMIPPLQFPAWQWVSFALATPVVWWCGWTFHRGAWQALRHRGFSMDSLVSLGSAVAWAWSAVAVIFLGAGEIGMTMHMSLTPSGGSGAEVYFEVAAGIVALVLLGRWLEARARRTAGSAIRALLAFAPDRATLLRDGVEREVPVAEVVVGDLVVVRPGDRIAVDGEVVEGQSAVDRALLTGESVPVEVGPGDEVEGGSLNAGGRIVVRALRVGSETAVHRVAALVEAAQAGKAPVQRLADRVAAVFVPAVILIAVGTLIGWLATGHPAGEAMTAAVDRNVFRVGRSERAYGDVARYVADHTEPEAVLISMQHSGLLRLYTGRRILRYDVLDPEWLDRAVEFLVATNRHPYIVVEQWELDRFTSRFKDSNRLGALDWNPIADLSGKVFVFDAARPDRALPPHAIPSPADDFWHIHLPRAPQAQRAKTGQPGRSSP